MIGAELHPEHEALLNRFHEAQREVGFDGEFDLPVVDRAVLAVADMAATIRAIQLLKTLGVTGNEARELMFNSRNQETPLTLDGLQAELRAICTART